MSEGVHAVQHQVEHQIEHESGGKGGGHSGGHDTQNKRIALVIAVLALLLAFSETLGKSAQTAALNYQIESSDLWNFFQAKNIRRTVTLVATDNAKIDQATTSDEARKAALAKQIDEWTKTAARYRSEPEAAHGLGEGTVELARRATEKEHERDLALNKYHYFEFASAALQIGIVLCSAAVITGMMALVWLAGGAGLIGLALMAMGLFFSHVHLLPGAH
jgi:ABC-type nickel/cobalt efflux system permease component RcnA